MQEIYLTVDRERDVFNINQAVFNSPMLKTDIVTIEPKNSTNFLPSSRTEKDCLWAQSPE
jgi:hypothetical protein